MKTVSKILFICLALLLAVSLFACTDAKKSGSWESATHLANKSFGNGSKTVQVEVKADDRSVTFTIKTDKAFLGEALTEHSLIEGEEGPYGLFITAVNGIRVSDADHTYWALYKDGTYSMTGVDTTPIADGEHYELVKEGY
ncbi:MAG: DUF4430 domain-containing protein [Ruminococcaceae bacterium]|nr:DUF4430 domain-containing protein [Oscillospiraceae bacterium]